MQIEYKKLNELVPYKRNPRKNDESVKYVANSIKEFGFKVPIVIDKNNVIVAGHTRYKAAKEIGLEEVPVIKADDLTDEQVKAFRIADNKVKEKSNWDIEKLKMELEGFDLDMTDFGFREFEIYMMSGEMEEDEEYYNQLLGEVSSASKTRKKNKRIIISYSTEEEENYLNGLLDLEKLKTLYKKGNLVKYEVR